MTAFFDAPGVGSVLAERYEIVRLIARGGMSEVYEATDRVLGRQVAVKLYRVTAVADRRRFEAEVHILASLNHPGLVHLYDAGEHGGDEYVVLELIDGPTLASILAEQGQLAEPSLRDLAAAVADALAFVHASDVVHRDVTPSNILRGPDGRARLADFGIARLLDTSRVTAVAHTVGTAAYMAPEQVKGSDVTSAADVYALGLVLLEALTGRRAFTGVGHEVALARLTRDPDVSTGVPDAWRPLLHEMTLRDPQARPTAVEVRDRVGALPVSTSAVVAPAPVIVGAMSDVASLAQTAVVPVVGGGTSVMPVVAPPAGPATDATQRAAQAVGAVFGRWRRALTIAAVVLVAGLTMGLAISRENPSPPGVVPASDTEADVPITVSTIPTVSTTIPPVTTVPSNATEPGKGKDNGNGSGKDKDDDD